MRSIDPSMVPTAAEVHNAFDRYFGRDDADDARHEPEVGSYHASHAGRCPRWRYYQDTIGSDFPSGIAERGNRIEDFVYDVFDEELVGKAGNDHPVRYEFDGIEITGSTDPYLERDDEVVLIAEVKSKNEIGPSVPEFHHLAQLNTYLSILGVHRGVLIYVSSGEYEIHIVQVEQDATLWEFTRTMHQVYHGYRESDELPPKAPMRDDECTWCSFRGLCARDERGDSYR